MRRRKTKGHGITVTIIEHRTRWEALDLFIQVQQAMEAQRFGKAATLLDMDPDLFTGCTLEEIAQAMQVRVHALALEAGIKPGATK